MQGTAIKETQFLLSGNTEKKLNKLSILSTSIKASTVQHDPEDGVINSAVKWKLRGIKVGSREHISGYIYLNLSQNSVILSLIPSVLFINLK